MNKLGPAVKRHYVKSYYHPQQPQDHQPALGKNKIQDKLQNKKNYE